MMARLLFPAVTLLTVLIQLAAAVPHGKQEALGDVNNSPSSGESDAIYLEDANSFPPIPSWFTSTLQARRLLALSTTGTVSTIFPSPLPANINAPSSVAGSSISLREYVADCDEHLPEGKAEGNPTFLALNVATTFRNTAAGSNISLQIDWWDHLNDTDPLLPGAPLSPASLPRVTLFGYIEPFNTPIPEETEAALKECYLASHPDAVVWLPGRADSPHSSFWARMVVMQVYWIGGFGNMARIGWMDVGDWKGIGRKESSVGDGRGWQDVRLPGEKA